MYNRTLQQLYTKNIHRPSHLTLVSHDAPTAAAGVLGVFQWSNTERNPTAKPATAIKNKYIDQYLEVSLENMVHHQSRTECWYRNTDRIRQGKQILYKVDSYLRTHGQQHVNVTKVWFKSQEWNEHTHHIINKVPAVSQTYAPLWYFTTVVPVVPQCGHVYVHGTDGQFPTVSAKDWLF